MHRDAIQELPKISLRMKPQMIEEIERLAHDHERTVSGEVRRAISAWIENCKLADNRA